MDTTQNLQLPYILAAQAQKHVTHNEGLLILDALVQLAVEDRDLASPHPSPAEGERFIVAEGPTGAWSGHAGHIAVWRDGGWTFHNPQEGWVCYVRDENRLLVWTGTAWLDAAAAIAALQNLSLLGVGTTADAVNPFSAKLNNALWTAKTVAEGGDGDLRYKMNKESAAKTLSLLMQTNYSGRAELGLLGDDDFHFKVSSDGAAWKEAVIADTGTGAVRFPAGLEHAPSRKSLSGLIFTPGGDGQISIFRFDAARSQHPRTAVIAAKSGDVLTLSSAVANQFFSTEMTGVSCLRVWNISKSAPGQPAWIKASPAADQLQVSNAADVASWLAGETVQLGDPTSVTPIRSIAVDISPMLQAMVGAVFRQSGLLLRAFAGGAGGGLVQIASSATGTGGSFVAVESDYGGAVRNGVLTCPTSVASPRSNSNLLFVRETDIGPNTLGLMGLSAMGVFG